MSNEPRFRYYSDSALRPVLDHLPAECQACGLIRTPVYTGPFYAVEEIESICLDCIETGHAARKFDGSFNDIVVECDGQVIDEEAAKAEPSVVDELLYKTPGYETWQGNQWAFHCGDGGVFLGHPSSETITNVSTQAKVHWEKMNGGVSWEKVMNGWTPQSPISVYHFRCRGCEMDLFLWEYD